MALDPEYKLERKLRFDCYTYWQLEALNESVKVLAGIVKELAHPRVRKEIEVVISAIDKNLQDLKNDK